MGGIANPAQNGPLAAVQSTDLIFCKSFSIMSISDTSSSSKGFGWPSFLEGILNHWHFPNISAEVTCAPVKAISSWYPSDG